MMASMIRRARPEEAREIAQVHLASQRLGYAGIMSDAYLASLTVTDRLPVWEERLASDSQGATWVLVDDAGIGGFIHVAPANGVDVADVADAWELVSIHVAPDRRHQGAGSRLLAEAIAALPPARLILWVLEANAPARAFYERSDFAADGARRMSTVGDRALPYLRYARVLT